MSMSNNTNNFISLSLDSFREIQNQKRLKKLKRLSRAYLSKCKELLNSNKNLAVFFIMLTFRDNNEFLNSREQVKSAIRQYIKLLKQDIERNQGKKLYTYFWVLEKQSRGVPHYHIFLITDKKCYIKYPDESYWAWGWSGLRRVDVSKISKNYLSKYLEKQEQKDIFDLQIFKSLKLYSIYVCKELKEFFKDVLIKRYSYFRYKLARFFNSFIRKRDGFYECDDFKVKLKYDFIILNSFVYIEFQKIIVFVANQLLEFKSFEDFESVMSFVYESY